MVDWGKLGKQALDLSKRAGEKGLDSFNDWRTDEERIQKAKEKKQDKKTEKLVKKKEKNYVPLKSKNVMYNELTGEFELIKQLKGKFSQDDLLSYELVQDESSITKGGVSVGRAIVGNAFLGGAGLVLGGLSGKKETNNVVKNIRISISLREQNGKIHERIIPIYSGKGIKLNDYLYNTYMTEAKEDLLVLDKIVSSH